MTVRVRAAVRALPPYRGLSSQRPGVRLDGNESPFGADPQARYPAAGPLRAAWARYLGVPPRALLVTAGSGPAIALTAELVLAPGDRAVLLEPSFELYGLAARRRGSEVLAVPTAPGRRFPLAAVREALAASEARWCALGLPDNPTGVSPTARQLRALVDAFPRTLFVVDEAYAEFAGRTALRLARRRRNVLVLRTMSKAWGLAGMRVGCVVGPARLIELLARLNVPYPVTAPAAAAARAALADDRPMRRVVRHVRRTRPQLARGLRGLGFAVRTTDANFVLVDAGAAERAGALTRALAGCGVAVRDRSHLPGMAGTVRISVGSEADHARLLDVLRLLTAPAPEALLLDMDGTLVDVRRSYDEIIWRMVRDRAGDAAGSREDVLAIKNDPRANDDVDAILLALARRGITADRRRIGQEFAERYRGPHGWYRRDRWLVSRAALRHLRRHLPLAVVTGRPRAEAALAFRLQPVRRLFRAVVTADDTRRHKPDPAPVRRALRALGLRHAWMIGDSPADLLAARAAGIPGIAVARGERAGMLRRFAPLAVLDGVPDLLTIMRGRALLAGVETS